MDSTYDYSRIAVLLSLPILSIIGIVLCQRFIGNRLWRRSIQAALSVPLLLFVAGCVLLIPYFYALHLETKMTEENTRTRNQLESVLHLYTVRQIQPTQSSWGKGYVLKPGDKMIQYKILLIAPLDVVYHKNNDIKVIFTSYE